MSVEVQSAQGNPPAVAGLAGMRDLIINGDGRVNQRTYTTVADDTYWCDRHYVLTQTATITPTILSDVADGLPSMMRLTQSQASAQRMGNAQIVEAQNCKKYRGKTRTLAGKLRCSSSQAIRFAILEWTGTADAVTSDVVNDWTNGTFTAGQFFNSTTLTVTGVGTITPSANTVTDWSLVATLGSSFNNLILVYWTEGTAAQNVTLDMSWELLPGDASGETRLLSRRSIGDETNLCRRYFQLNPPAEGHWKTGDATIFTTVFPFNPPMRTLAAAAIISGTGAARRAGVGTYDASAVADGGSATVGGIVMDVTTTAASAGESGQLYGGRISASAEL